MAVGAGHVGQHIAVAPVRLGPTDRVAALSSQLEWHKNPTSRLHRTRDTTSLRVIRYMRIFS